MVVALYANINQYTGSAVRKHKSIHIKASAQRFKYNHAQELKQTEQMDKDHLDVDDASLHLLPRSHPQVALYANIKSIHMNIESVHMKPKRRGCQAMKEKKGKTQASACGERTLM